jgi:hypothetical protein
MFAQCWPEFVKGACGAKIGFDKLNLTSSAIFEMASSSI